MLKSKSYVENLEKIKKYKGKTYNKPYYKQKIMELEEHNKVIKEFWLWYLSAFNIKLSDLADKEEENDA